jgi:ubiquinone/menaquinone biosynthesis C-methylase UbiE
MEHSDHVRLIQEGVEGVGRRWLELGAGAGAFTLALADLIGAGGEIMAVDRDAGDLGRLAETMTRRFPKVGLRTVTADFDRWMDLGPAEFDGLLAANSLHFVRDPAAVIGRLHDSLRPGARILIVEYDSDSGNPWVPFPFSFETWARAADQLGLVGTRLVGRVPSRVLGSIYAAASEVPLVKRSDDSPQATSTETS